MDRIDWKITAELESDARLSFAELSDRVGLSKSPCWSRVRDLQRHGVIGGFGAHLDPASLGLNVQALVDIQIRLDAHMEFETAVLSHPAIMECHTTAGDSDYILKIYVKSVDHLDELLRHEISRLPGVQRLSTKIFLKTIKSRSSLTTWALQCQKMGQ